MKASWSWTPGSRAFGDVDWKVVFFDGRNAESNSLCYVINWGCMNRIVCLKQSYDKVRLFCSDGHTCMASNYVTPSLLDRPETTPLFGEPEMFNIHGGCRRGGG